MSKVGKILWWTGFLIFSVIVQIYIEGLDALIVGIIVATQERNYKVMGWMLPLVICLQEGIGSQNFGMTLLSLASFFVLHKVLYPVSAASITLFMLMLSLSIGGMRAVLNGLACALHSYPFSMDLAIHLGIVQTIYTFLAWETISHIRNNQPPAIPQDSRES